MPLEQLLWCRLPAGRPLRGGRSPSTSAARHTGGDSPPVGGLQLKSRMPGTKFCLKMLVDTSLSCSGQSHRGGAPCPARSRCPAAEDKAGRTPAGPSPAAPAQGFGIPKLALNELIFRESVQCHHLLSASRDKELHVSIAGGTFPSFPASPETEGLVIFMQVGLFCDCRVRSTPWLFPKQTCR